MNHKNVPDIVIGRLPWYLQVLNQMAEQGLSVVSSKVFADKLGISAAQIRKDLSYFGGFGRQGTGYSVLHLIEQLQNILNLNQIWHVAIVGAGALGRALTRYQGFSQQGIEIVLLYDINPDIVGNQVGAIKIKHVDAMALDIEKMKIKIAILTVPGETAQATAEKLVEAGINAILNYTPQTLILPETIHVQNIDPVLQLQRMMYYLHREEKIA